MKLVLKLLFFERSLKPMLLFLSLFYIFYHTCTAEYNRNKTCSKNTSASTSKSFLLVVSTINGKVTSLDVRENGKALWTIDTGYGPLVSSSISKMEIYQNGVPIRLVPALDGCLYKYDGNSIGPVPISADSLLSSSYQLNEETMVVGGKRTHSIGLHPQHGQLAYTCDIDGCKYFGEKEVEDSDDIVVVSQTVKTVRAVESRTGTEKWNFSVGQHEMQYLKGDTLPRSDAAAEYIDEDSSIEVCPDATDSLLRKDDVMIRSVVPLGQIHALSKSDSRIIWSHQFESPIAKVWMVYNGDVEELDLFSHRVIPALSHAHAQDAPPSPPLLYIGTFRDEVYVQSNPVFIKQTMLRHTSADGSSMALIPRVIWSPYLATSASRTPALRGVKLPSLTYVKQLPSQTGDVQVWTDNYPFDMGYYLYPDTTPLLLDNVTIIEFDSGDITVTLWNWWKEVVVISLVTSILFHLLITKYLYRASPCLSPQVSVEGTLPVTCYDVVSDSNKKESIQDSHFVSTYDRDFEHMQVLGTGGFGVVYEAKKRMEDVHYAIKCIPIHHSEESREKSLREVKTLAKLDHIGIVSYKNSWIETPPAGWQCQHYLRSKSEGHLLSFAPDTEYLSTRHKDDQLDNYKNDQYAINMPRNSRKGFYVSESEESGSYSMKQNNDTDSDCVADNNNMNINARLSPRENMVSDATDSVVVFQEDSGCKNAGEEWAEHEVDTKSNESRTSTFSEQSSISAHDREVVKHSSHDNSHPQSFLYIQMQLCKRESLKDWLASNTLNRDRETVIDYFDQIVAAVAYVHQNGLFHRDLKPSNILFSLDGVVKIGDFGLVTAAIPQRDATVKGSKTDCENHTAQVGTSLYMSPEQERGLCYTNKVDIYALGMIFFELLYPFSTQSERIHVLNNLKHKTYPPRFVREMPKELSVVKLLTSNNPNDRPSAEQILDHEILSAYQARRMLGPMRARSISGSS